MAARARRRRLRPIRASASRIHGNVCGTLLGTTLASVWLFRVDHPRAANAAQFDAADPPVPTPDEAAFAPGPAEPTAAGPVVTGVLPVPPWPEVPGCPAVAPATPAGHGTTSCCRGTPAAVNVPMSSLSRTSTLAFMGGCVVALTHAPIRPRAAAPRPAVAGVPLIGHGASTPGRAWTRGALTLCPPTITVTLATAVPEPFAWTQAVATGDALTPTFSSEPGPLPPTFAGTPEPGTLPSSPVTPPDGRSESREGAGTCRAVAPGTGRVPPPR